MRVRRPDASPAAPAVLWALALSLLTACGGGGGGGPPPEDPPAGPAVLGRFSVVLSGAAETTVVDPAARAVGLLELSDDGTCAFSVTGAGPWVSSVTGLHVHGGAAGSDGSVVVDLLADGAAFDASTATASDSFAISPALAAAIAAAPQSFYVNVHTTAAPQGLARGQLAPFAPLEWHALLDASEETPPNLTGSRGAASLRVTADGRLAWVLATAAPNVTTLTGAHVHGGGPGVAGGVLFDLDLDAGFRDGSASVATGSALLPMSAITRVTFDPAAFYVNLHTPAYPNGVARGQLATGKHELWATLRGDREVTPVVPAARGAVGLELTTFTSGHASLAVPVAQGIGSLTDARIRSGTAGTDGASVIDLRAGADFASSHSTGSGEGTIGYDQVLYTRLLADPAAFYADLRSPVAPAGLARGQLTRAPQSLVAQLTGGNEVPPVTPSNGGKLRVILTGLHACSWSLKLTQPLTSTVNGAHVHDGAAGLTGPVLIDLLGDDAGLSGDTLTGSALFTGRNFVRLLADAAAFYGNAHTPAFLTGAARGQMFHLTEDSAPAGLVYTSPVTCVTGQAIADNVPDSVGGAVATYSVSPALPAGLSLNATTGVISGTPTAITPQAVYTVTASNATGTSSFGVTITVNEGPPLSLAYATPVVYVVGTAIASNTPTSTGGAITSYSVSPALPGSLSLNTTTGVISGTPSASAAAADYTVTGSNGAGSVQAVVNIKVDASLQAPSGLSYSTPVTYTTGTAITANVPSVSGGAVTTWSVSPALPSGLTLNATTGTISGVPTTVTSAATYTVTAANATGSTQAAVSITITLGAPTNLVYDNNPALGYVLGGTFPTMTPSSQGGAVASYSVSPALPAGISLNTSTGVISGSPTATSSQTTYTVTATNATGSTTGNVTITVLQ